MLDDPKSARVRGVAALKRKETRSETGLFLLEGPQGLKELTALPELAKEVFVTEAAAERYQAELESLQAAGVSVILATDEVIDRMADTQHPQGVLAVVEQLDLLVADLLGNSPRLVAVLDRVGDPGNAGTVVRAAAAAGADGVVFTEGSVDLYNSKLVRATAGTIFTIDTVIDQRPDSLAKKLREAGLQIFAATAGGTPITELTDKQMSAPTAWVFGNEAHGVSDEWLELADHAVALPMYGRVESLNIAAAAAVCLYSSAFAQNTNR